jgi:hypothetical protein
MNVFAAIRGDFDTIGAVIAFVFIAMIVCLSDPTEDILERCRFAIACKLPIRKHVTPESSIIYEASVDVDRVPPLTMEFAR